MMPSPLPTPSIHWEARVGTQRWPTSSRLVYAQSAAAAIASLDRLFDGDRPTGANPLDRADYAELFACGGFPEMVLGPTTRRFRATWCESYLRTVTALANVEQAAEIRRPELVGQLLDQVAARSAGAIVVSDLGREVQASEGLINSYLDVLDTLYLVRLLPAWTTSRTNRAKRRRVAHLVDTALAAHLVDQNADDLAQTGSAWFGPLLESFVVAELAKQATSTERPASLAHCRDRDQREVDLVSERGTQVAAIEVKATATPRPHDARHLAFLRDRLEDRFTLGVVLHTGHQHIVLGDRLVAAPVSSPWARYCRTAARSPTRALFALRRPDVDFVPTIPIGPQAV